jgi:hypothetical protein
MFLNLLHRWESAELNQEARKRIARADQGGARVTIEQHWRAGKAKANRVTRLYKLAYGGIDARCSWTPRQRG